MAGVEANSALLGWHGLQGDRRFAFRRLNDTGGFPWLSASKLPKLVLYQPMDLDENSDDPVPARVRTPEGTIFPLTSPELQDRIAKKFGSAVELMKLRNGIFDEADVSVIHLSTIAAICREALQNPDSRRFRANIVITSDSTRPFIEDTWVGGRLLFGDGDSPPALAVTMRDLRCMMINIDPGTGKQDPLVMKTAVRMNENFAGVYGQVIRTGIISVGMPVSLIIEK